ncbi:MAG: alkaline phosphatase, partial [Clostridia bacterium]|nr:alkaline phosphatase [Clostridia bacterium]
PDGSAVYSVAHAAQQAGYAVGVSTTVCINHATPGAFYAHQPSRNNYPQIAKEMLTARGRKRSARAGHSFQDRNSSCRQTSGRPEI